MPDGNTPISTKIEVAVIVSQLEAIKAKLEHLEGYDARIKRNERVIWMLTGVTGLMIIILAPIASDAIKLWLGL